MVATYSELADKVVVVTGGGGGIGAGVVRAFAEQGSRVVATERTPGKAQAVVDTLDGGGDRHSWLSLDVTDSAAVERVFAEIVDRFGRIDVLVNAAGGHVRDPDGHVRWKGTHELSEEHWDAVIAINLKGTFLCCRAAMAPMMSQRSGRIINVSSRDARTLSAPSISAYAAAKAAILNLTRHLALELAPYGVTVNAIAPGLTRTPPAALDANPEKERIAAAGIPLGRVAEPSDQAAACVFLASDSASYITGTTLDVNGGKLML